LTQETVIVFKIISNFMLLVYPTT